MCADHLKTRLMSFQAENKNVLNVDKLTPYLCDLYDCTLEINTCMQSLLKIEPIRTQRSEINFIFITMRETTLVFSHLGLLAVSKAEINLLLTGVKILPTS